jgi:isopentenyl diphosphate isomerase/L-lactate dehydrogenase-like FMN-dependent dehydrogenase
MLNMLRDECDNAMALCGAATPQALDRSLVV